MVRRDANPVGCALKFKSMVDRTEGLPETRIIALTIANAFIELLKKSVYWPVIGNAEIICDRVQTGLSAFLTWF